ncbi:alpha/beta hydrolase [Psychromarinibacter sp. C21-152]|uniref:Alpha/beta hydrolase n=1 Tax=Psychromarinibacter sediminicola TaxID=3033385 RepID=A0AAE3NQB7_9RHOB|nr:alpha/beta hydrolase [Psychromarinibacter sediminicola]MDF0600132.1 alpha/beta hydrolase [Psychromarinibacter sediminicola]
MTDPLVLIPGMMADSRGFLPQIVELSWDTALHISAPLHASSVEEMAQDTLATAPETFALCGHGLGGMVAIEILRRAPERVTRLALMDTSCQSEMPTVAAARETRIVAARAGRLAEAMHDELKPDHLSAGPERDGIHQVMQEMAQDLGAEVYIRQSRALQKRPDQQGTLRRARTPTLILCGEDDTLYPVRRHEFMAHLMPMAKLEVVAGAGHLPALENPNAVSAILRNWLSWPTSAGRGASASPNWT